LTFFKNYLQGFKKLAPQTPASLQELMDKVEEFINAEETMKALMGFMQKAKERYPRK
jgi:hypothetical protein